jgi:hypothetical protein
LEILLLASLAGRVTPYVSVLEVLFYNLLRKEKFVLTAASGEFPEWHFTAA